jgi:simple sugar transport system permease protein
VTVTKDQVEGPTEPAPPKSSRLRRTLRWFGQANQFVVTALGLAVALVVGGIILTFSTPQTLHAVGTFTDHPLTSLGTILQTIGDTYRALFTGSIVDPPQLWHSIATGQGWVTTLTPICETLTVATPLAIAGLGIGIGFQTGIFNIGGAGQVTVGAVCATYVATSVHLPAIALLPLCMLAGIAGGALTGAIPGVLKAYTGAHEVIVTIMLNYTIGSLLLWDLETPGLGLQQPGQGNTISKTIPPAGQLPYLFGANLSVNVGLIIAIVAAVVAWWLMDRSTLGFRFRVTGASPRAARTAGIDSKHITVLVFLVSGAFVGLAGMVQVSGIDLFIENIGQQGYASTLGFTAITVALLGRNRPLGILLGSFLIAALTWGATNAEATLGIFPDLSSIILAVMVLCVATPALISAMFHLKKGSAASFNLGGWGS